MNKSTCAHLSEKNSSILETRGWIAFPSASNMLSVWKENRGVNVCGVTHFLSRVNMGVRLTCAFSRIEISSVCANRDCSSDFSDASDWVASASLSSLTWAKVLFSLAFIPCRLYADYRHELITKGKNTLVHIFPFVSYLQKSVHAWQCFHIVDRVSFLLLHNAQNFGHSLNCN